MVKHSVVVVGYAGGALMPGQALALSDVHTLEPYDLVAERLALGLASPIDRVDWVVVARNLHPNVPLGRKKRVRRKRAKHLLKIGRAGGVCQVTLSGLVDNVRVR